MRLLIAGEDQQIAERVVAVLSQHGWECPAGHTVPLEVAADRGGRLLPELVVFLLPPEPTNGLDALRETRHTLPNIHILAVGPAKDPKVILETLKQGADEYLDQELLETELTGSVIRLKTRESLPPGQRCSGRLVAVLAPSGGSGASTVATSISAALARAHGECGLVDLRLAVGDLAPMLDLRPMHTLADACDHVSRLDQTLFEQILARHASGIFLLAAPTQQADTRRVTSKGVRRALTLARVRFAYVVADVSNVLSGEQMEALWQADVILLILRLDYTSVRNTRRVIDMLVGMGIGRDRMRLVVNGYGQRRQLAVAQAEEALGMKIAHFIPHDPAAVNLAVNSGVPLVTKCRFAKISRRLRDLAGSVNGGLH